MINKNAPNSQIYHDVIFKILHTDVIQMSQTIEGQSEDNALLRHLSLSLSLSLCGYAIIGLIRKPNIESKYKSQDKG